jgi:hypothetical protein
VNELVPVVGIARGEGLGGSEGEVGYTVVSWRILVSCLDGAEGALTLRSEVY